METDKQPKPVALGIRPVRAPDGTVGIVVWDGAEDDEGSFISARQAFWLAQKLLDSLTNNGDTLMVSGAVDVPWSEIPTAGRPTGGGICGHAATFGLNDVRFCALPMGHAGWDRNYGHECSLPYNPRGTGQLTSKVDNTLEGV